MQTDARLLHCGDTVLVIEFGDRIERSLSDRVLILARQIDDAQLPGIVEVVPTFRSLAVHYDPLSTSADILGPQIGALIGTPGKSSSRSRIMTLPVCYEGAFGPDIPFVAERAGLSVRDVIERHSGAIYHAYMLGFLPGYAYLGDLDPSLRLPRRETPRLAVPAGSVAIATSLTAVYPYESPGGWHLIGRTPVRMFAPDWAVPSLIGPGDRVKFQPVTADEYTGLAERCAAGLYSPGIEESAS